MLITDPARLLPGSFWTFDLPLPCSCYVDGCVTTASVGRLHKRYGFVDSCPSHDPERVGYAKAFFAAPLVVEDAPVVDPSTPEAPQTPEQIIAHLLAEVIGMTLQNDDRFDALGGSRAKLKTPKPKLPPSGTALRSAAA